MGYEDRSRLQKLVDICFEIGLTIYGDERGFFKNCTMEQAARWIAIQLRECGFPTHPVGACWGSLETGRDDNKEHVEKEDAPITKDDKEESFAKFRCDKG